MAIFTKEMSNIVRRLKNFSVFVLALLYFVLYITMNISLVVAAHKVILSTIFIVRDASCASFVTCDDGDHRDVHNDGAVNAFRGTSPGVQPREWNSVGRLHRLHVCFPILLLLPHQDPVVP